MDKYSKKINTVQLAKRRTRIINYELVRKWKTPNDVQTSKNNIKWNQ